MLPANKYIDDRKRMGLTNPCNSLWYVVCYCYLFLVCVLKIFSIKHFIVYHLLFISNKSRTVQIRCMTLRLAILQIIYLFMKNKRIGTIQYIQFLKNSFTKVHYKKFNKNLSVSIKVKGTAS